MNDKKPFLQVKALHKKFEKLEVLKGVDLDVYKGDVIAVIGPSGCGKSTFLRCLNFLEMPNAGEISFEGKIVFKNERVYFKRKMKALKAQKNYDKTEFKALEEQYLALKAIEKPIQKKMNKEKRIAEEQRLKAERKARLTKKYGKTYADLIIQGKVRIGMTAEMCREAWGTPDDINRSSGSWGMHEQWCYDWGGYLYMENGKLTSIQN